MACYPLIILCTRKLGGRERHSNSQVTRRPTKFNHRRGDLQDSHSHNVKDLKLLATELCRLG